jgi:hypothetical protein
MIVDQEHLAVSQEPETQASDFGIMAGYFKGGGRFTKPDMLEQREGGRGGLTLCFRN